ncbi:MAG: uracil-DNA glycosylase, partial [Azonexus sp.]|nr:uracil-DNA glycosylase [Azonexus sp.]
GEGPGSEEDARGEPFVGQAGKLLDNMLAALDIARGNRVYIGNAVKCRPPGNRTPEAAEIAACRPYLERQIALLQPKIIVLLGKTAVHSLLREDKSLASLRGQRLLYAGIPVIVTYHPAYLLRNLPDKAKAWEDLLFARRVLRAGS